MTEQIRSLFDTSLGIVYYNVPGSDIPEIQEQLAAARRRRHDSPDDRDAYVDLLRFWVQTNHYPLFAHESAHVLQALTHPALLHRCLREFSLVMSVMYAVLHTDAPLPLPLLLPEPWYAELNWATQQRRLTVDQADEPHIEEPRSKWPMPNDLSEVDLLEDSASIFQYKAEIGGPGSGRLYRNWLDEEYRYSRTFEFLASILGDEDGYVALPALVMAANTTNWPVDSFVSLVAATRKYGIRPAELGIERYWGFLTTFLRVQVPLGEPPDPREMLDGEAPVIRIDRRGMLAMAAQSPLHPLTFLVRMACADEAHFDRLRETIFHPHRAFDRRLRRTADWLHPFEPPVSLYRVVDGESVAADTLLGISSTLMNVDPPGGAEHWVPYVLQMIRAKSLAASAVWSKLTPESHACPHVGCEYHGVGLCKSWVEVPRAPDECNFPKWLRDDCERSWDFEQEVLRRVSEGDG